MKGEWPGFAYNANVGYRTKEEKQMTPKHWPVSYSRKTVLQCTEMIKVVGRVNFRGNILQKSLTA